MPSTVIRKIDYDANRSELTVTFVTGKHYLYLGVPQSVVTAFRTAPSRGAFFNLEIRDAFDYRELESIP